MAIEVFPSSVLEALAVAKLNPGLVYRTVQNTLEEDLQWGPDATTDAIFSTEQVIQARMTVRQPGCLAGVPVAASVPFVLREMYKVKDPIFTAASVDVEIRKQDGAPVECGDVVLEFSAPARLLLTAERTLLNLASQLSGTATATAEFVQALEGTGAVVRDTRKTIPGLRELQKYAVRCGGGENHRMGLGDAALIKDNHIAAAGSLSAAVEAVRAAFSGLPLEVECDTISQVMEAVAQGVQLVLLDNMDTAMLCEAVSICRPAGVSTEASGGLTLADATAVGATGVNYISVGALTHSAPILDLALDM